VLGSKDQKSDSSAGLEGLEPCVTEGESGDAICYDQVNIESGARRIKVRTVLASVNGHRTIKILKNELRGTRCMEGEVRG